MLITKSKKGLGKNKQHPMKAIMLRDMISKRKTRRALANNQHNT